MTAAFSGTAVAASEDPAGAKIEAQHMILSATQDRIAVLEIISFSPGTGVDGEQLTLKFPDGFYDLAFDAQRVPQGTEVTAEGLSVPLRGSEGASLAVTYSLPWDGTSLQVNRRADLSTGIFFILTRENELVIQGHGYTDAGLVEMGGSSFGQYYREMISAGDDLGFTVVPGEGLPQGGVSPDVSAPLTGGSTSPEGPNILNKGFHGGTANVRLWQRFTGLPSHGGLVGAIILMAMVAVLVLLGYEFWRSSGRRRAVLESESPARRSDGGAGVSPEKSRLENERRRLIREIAALDLEGDKGGLDPAAHASRRESLKARLVEVTIALRRLAEEELR